MTLPRLSPADACAMIDAGGRLVDIRDNDEHVREYIAGASNVPLDRIGDLTHDDRPLIFHCRSGVRTVANAAQLAAAAQGAPAFILEGGIDAWRRAGYPTVINRSQPLDIMRQMQITAGSLVLAGILLGVFVQPAFFILSALIGTGLIFAGATGWCGMAKLLRAMPWNNNAVA